MRTQRMGEGTMRNLPPVACKVDPTNESSWIIPEKPWIDQGDAAVSFSVQPHGPSSKEQCEPSGRRSTIENKESGKIGETWLWKNTNSNKSENPLWLSKLPNLRYTVKIGLICLFPESLLESQHLASGNIWNFLVLSYSKHSAKLYPL